VVRLVYFMSEGLSPLLVGGEMVERVGGNSEKLDAGLTARIASFIFIPIAIWALENACAPSPLIQLNT